MKPNFALNLSHEGISLLHRNEGSKAGWSLVGEVALDDPEMASKLDMLRKTAAGLDQSGVATKLVIPNSQILYTEVSAPGADDITREVQIRAALEGLTPYEVGQLVFDWRRAKGKMVRVAVVARETLQEAEAFAKDHRFNPVSFVARPQNGFKGEAFFGMASGASALLGAGEKVEPDAKPVPRIATLRPNQPPEDGKSAPEAGTEAGTENKAEGNKADEKAAPTAQKPAPDQAAKATPDDTAPGGNSPAAPAATKPGQPATKPGQGAPDAPDTAITPSGAGDDDEDARIAALLAEVPEPEPRDAQSSADMAPDSAAKSQDGAQGGAEKPAPDQARAKAPPAPVLAPFPPSLDMEDSARQAPKTPAKAAKTVKAAKKSAAKSATRSADTSKNMSADKTEAKTGQKSATKSAAQQTPPPPPPRREIPPLVQGAVASSASNGKAKTATSPASTASARANDTQSAPATATPGKSAPAASTAAQGEKPAPSFASRRRVAPSGDVQKADLDAPGAVITETQKHAQKHARARAMEMALAKAPAQAKAAARNSAGQANGASAPPPLPARAAIPSASDVSPSLTSPALAGDSAGGRTQQQAQGRAGQLSGQLQARLQRGAGTAARLTRAASLAASSAAAKATKGLIKRRADSAEAASPAETSAEAAIGQKPAQKTEQAAANRPASKGFGAKIAGLSGRKANGASAGASALTPGDTAIAPAPPGTSSGAGNGATATGTGQGRNPLPASTTTAASAPAIGPTPSEAERLTLFGARRAQQENIGGKPKYLGLILTLVLLLIMAVIALGSVFLYSGATTSGDAPNGGADFAAASVPEALLPSPSDGTSPSDGAALSPGLSPEPATDPLGDGANDLAALPLAPQSPGGLEINTDPIAPLAAEPPAGAQTTQAPEPAPRSPEVLSQEAAQTRYAATGIWEKAPLDPPEPRGSRIDDLYIASIDPKVTGNDAVALPPVSATAPESRPATPLPPAAPGTTFALNDEGLVAPSPEGTLSPEGILIYSGRPEVVPPARPGIVRPEILPSDALRQFRPKPRPTGLIEESQRANNGGNTLLELAAYRPNARPAALAAAAIDRARAGGSAVDAAVAGVIAEGEIINATDQAVAASPQPDHRPGNFATIVASARARADASDGSTVVAASAAPTTAPSIPTRANVATQATITNAIRLHDTNLIGIYGSSTSRRALVRLKSGRYVKVSVGERLNGGKVVSITENRLIYTKNGRNYTLELLQLG